MAEFGDATDAIGDTEMWTEAAMVLGGLAAAVVLRNGIDSRFDLPDEVYGVIVAATAAMLGYSEIAVGGMGHTGIKLAERVGLKGTVENAGA
ncbi:hypothetical protein EXE53_15415 [Halorubrum sp. SD626R]|uniref:hypothetical protein n=1 Tax=Halorubrum sp. SD626R TaxID=1419722 RepID=UPI0011369535|nr:hypothetical protein [Halorubrum sp. SD626R]TKX79551.1 hypothetical protein EXE53_15415 [Halorubrum sp. SD626R]